MDNITLVLALEAMVVLKSTTIGKGFTCPSSIVIYSP